MPTLGTEAEAVVERREREKRTEEEEDLLRKEDRAKDTFTTHPLSNPRIRTLAASASLVLSVKFLITLLGNLKLKLLKKGVPWLIFTMDVWVILFT